MTRFMETMTGAMPGAVYREPLDPVKCHVIPREKSDCLDGRPGVRTIMLAGHRATVFPGMGGEPGLLVWKGRKYSTIDYKGRRILTPDDRMWGWFQQRQIVSFTADPEGRNTQNLVVFGTKDDKYTFYPEKFGFKGRRQIKHEGGWADRIEEYHERLLRLNPRHQKFGHKFSGRWARMFGKNQLQYRWDEIHEESGLRVKHAPAILMINRFVTSQEIFVATYLSGSQGADPKGREWRARADHVTDHEFYRMFSGKHRERILGTTMFADAATRISQIGKNQNRWYNKNQIARWWRIKNQN